MLRFCVLFALEQKTRCTVESYSCWHKGNSLNVLLWVGAKIPQCTKRYYLQFEDILISPVMMGDYDRMKTEYAVIFRFDRRWSGTKELYVLGDFLKMEVKHGKLWC